MSDTFIPIPVPVNMNALPSKGIVEKEQISDLPDDRPNYNNSTFMAMCEGSETPKEGSMAQKLDKFNKGYEKDVLLFGDKKEGSSVVTKRELYDLIVKYTDELGNLSRIRFVDALFAKLASANSDRLVDANKTLVPLDEKKLLEHMEDFGKRWTQRDFKKTVVDDSQKLYVKELVKKFGTPPSSAIPSVKDIEKEFWKLEEQCGFKPAYASLAIVAHSLLKEKDKGIIE